MSSDRDYFLSRAEEEDARATNADDQAAREAHRNLAEYYRNAAVNRGPRSIDRSIAHKEHD